MKIKKGDNVIVTTGKSKGKVGKVLFVLPKQNRIVVEGANMHKRHTKARNRNEKGQILELPMPFSASNVKVVCAKCEKPTRIARRIEGQEKLRICIKCKQTIGK